MDGFGCMLSIRVKGGFEAAKRFCERTQLFTLADSLGGVESLSNHPAVMTHAIVPVEHRKRLGIGDEVVRLSGGVGSHADQKSVVYGKLVSLSVASGDFSLIINNHNITYKI